MVEQSTDLIQWTQVSDIAAGPDGSMSYQYLLGEDARGFFRFKKQ